MKDNNKTNKLTNVLFIIYLIALFWIIVFKFNVRLPSLRNMRSINLIPFSEPLILNGKIAFSEIIMNVVIFVPLGIYAGILFKRWSIGKKLFLFFLISLICEVFQFILNVGASDITDIINNTLGGIIGLMIYKGIEKAFKNIIHNAIMYSPQGETVFLELTEDSKENQIQIQVINTGIQIKAEELQQLFQPFYRLEKSRNRNTGGSGLGLYIVKQIFTSLSINYSFDNVENGIRFLVSFPQIK